MKGRKGQPKYLDDKMHWAARELADWEESVNSFPGEAPDILNIVGILRQGGNVLRRIMYERSERFELGIDWTNWNSMPKPYVLVEPNWALERLFASDNTPFPTLKHDAYRQIHDIQYMMDNLMAHAETARQGYVQAVFRGTQYDNLERFDVKVIENIEEVHKGKIYDISNDRPVMEDFSSNGRRSLPYDTLFAKPRWPHKAAVLRAKRTASVKCFRYGLPYKG